MIRLAPCSVDEIFVFAQGQNPEGILEFLETFEGCGFGACGGSGGGRWRRSRLPGIIGLRGAFGHLHQCMQNKSGLASSCGDLDPSNLEGGVHPILLFFLIQGQ